MSEPTPTRTISGFGEPRARAGGVHPDASRLIARNRAPQPTPTEPAPSSNPATMERPHTAAPTSTSATPIRHTTAKEQLNAAVPTDVRARIRAAYRATAAAEGHRSFSDLIAALLDVEATRLEQRYNNGQPFTGGEHALPPGRPLGD